MLHNKLLMLTALTIHCPLPFCIAKCSVNMVDSAAVVQGQGECYDDGVYGKSLYRR